MPFLTPFLGEGSPTKIDYRKKVGTLILSSPLEDLGFVEPWLFQRHSANREGAFPARAGCGWKGPEGDLASHQLQCEAGGEGNALVACLRIGIIMVSLWFPLKLLSPKNGCPKMIHSLQA